MSSQFRCFSCRTTTLNIVHPQAALRCNAFVIARRPADVASESMSIDLQGRCGHVISEVGRRWSFLAGSAPTSSSSRVSIPIGWRPRSAIVAASDRRRFCRRRQPSRAPAASHHRDIPTQRRIGPTAMAAPTAPNKWEGVDEGLARMVARANLDYAPERRRVRDAFKDVQLSIDHCLFKAQYPGIQVEECYKVNRRGLEIFAKSWIPENCKIKGLIFFCHGYGDTCTFFFEGISRKLASAGYGIFAMDYPGFGLSEGLHGYIPSFDELVDDVIECFSKIKEESKYKGLPSFLFGQSMGGAVAINVHLKQSHSWDGAILVAPMCKMADDVVPSWPVQKILIALANILPKEKLVPQKDLAEMAFKDIKKREQCKYNVIAYQDKPRLRTALELLRTTQEIERRLEEVSLPLIILHGEADAVTDPAVSKALYDKASSQNKRLCLYKDACHAILEGESDEAIEKVFGDIIAWLDEHSDTRVKS